LCRWFANEARRIYSILSESDEERDTRRLVEFIQTRGRTMSVRGLMRGNCRRYPDADSAESALAALVDAGLARWIDPQTTMKGGKPIKVVELRMTHDTDDTDPDDGGDEDRGPQSADDTGSDASPGPRPVSPGATMCDDAAQAAEYGVIGVMRHARGTESGTNGEAVRENSHPGEPGTGPAVMRSAFVETTCGTSTPAYSLVSDRAGLEMVAAALDGTGLVGLDLETTGLNPRAERVRLLSLALDTIDGRQFAYLIDCFAVDPSPLWAALVNRELVVHNGAFDLAFLAELGFIPAGTVRDTMVMAHLLTAGTRERVTLAACCRRWLGRDLNKTEQKSDWAGPLTRDQLDYAALDVGVLAPLLEILAAKVKAARLDVVSRIEQRCLPAVVWMGRHGVSLDRGAWQSLARAAEEEAVQLDHQLHQAAPQKPGELFDAWNWDSTRQAQQALALAGCTVENTADETLARVDHPLARLLRRYRLARKRVSTYGADWLAHVAADGRIYPGWRQMGAESGRMSCSGPNMQQLPRGDHRRCVAAPPGRVLVKADYSQIELRIAAKVSGDPELLAAYQRGDDLHARTARAVLGVEQVTSQDRQLAKALNFGLLYGMGSHGFRLYARAQYAVDLTESEAHRYRDAFFKSYPGLAAWHRRTRHRRTPETRTLVGRRRLLNAKTPDTHRLNTPVQGSGADGLKTALALLWERREVMSGAFPVLAVHDEIVVEAGEDQADDAAVWLKAAMVDAMSPLVDPVPVEVEVKIARTWGGD
jgi:DNA polymerase-1